MKLYHFALFFIIIAGGLFITARIQLMTKMQSESIKKSEYGCLVEAVNAVTEVVFDEGTRQVSQRKLEEAKEVFFQTMGVIHDGTADVTAWEIWKERIPCLVIFDEEGYYVYRYVPGDGYGWTVKTLDEDGDIPDCFFRETEEVLAEYLRQHGGCTKNYRMEPSGNSVWEQSLEPPCVFALYAPPVVNRLSAGHPTLLYAATGIGDTGYYVTEDNYCHYAFCECVGQKTVVAYYVTQKESAQDGAMPCESCMK